jgi:ketosteroid isomerase-like protein
MKKSLPLLIAAIALMVGCKGKDKNAESKEDKTAISASTEDHSAEVAEIMKLDSAWNASSQAKSAEGWLSYYSPDAMMMPPGEKACSDAASREASIKAMFSIPGMSLSFQTTKAEVSKSGDIGYAYGVYQWKSKDPKGNDYNETGKYSEVWKKQSNGSWKCSVDIWNADTPPPVQ